MVGDRMKLSLQSASKIFGFFRVWESDSPGCPGGDGVGTLITRLAILHSYWSSGSRDSSVALHRSFLHSLSRRVTDLCKRVTSALRVGSLLTCHCFRSRSFRRISSWMPAGIGGRGSARGRRFGVDAARAFRTAPENFSTHVSNAIPSCNSGSNGIWSSKWVWKLAQSVRLKSGWSGGCWKDERHVVSMSTGSWTELSAEHEVRYTRDVRFLVITMSKISRVAKGLYGLVVEVSGPKMRQEFPSA